MPNFWASASAARSFSCVSARSSTRGASFWYRDLAAASSRYTRFWWASLRNVANPSPSSSMLGQSALIEAISRGSKWSAMLLVSLPCQVRWMDVRTTARSTGRPSISVRASSRMCWNTSRTYSPVRLPCVSRMA